MTSAAPSTSRASAADKASLRNKTRQAEGPYDVLDKTAALAPSPTAIRAPSTVPKTLQRYLCLDDFEPTARPLLPKFLYGYVSGGAETDAAVRDNRKALDEYGFVPRVLNDVSSRDQTTSLFGKPYPSPFGIPRWAPQRCALIAAISSMR